MYSFDSIIRYSEVGEDCCLTLSGLMNYFQDCSSFHSEEVGLGIDFLRKNNRAWYINAWQIDVERYPKFMEKVTIGTMPYEFNGFVGCRNYMMLDERGARIACANSIWAYINTENGKFAKADQYVIDRYRIEPKLDMEYKDRKIKLPKEGVKLSEIRVGETQIDTNHHMNNEEYVAVASNLLSDFAPKHVRVEYRKSAVLGDILYPVLFEEEDKKLISLNGEDGKAYAVVEYLQK